MSVVDPAGKRTCNSYSSAGEAVAAVRRIRAALAGPKLPPARTLGEALVAYRDHMKEIGNKLTSAVTTAARIDAMFHLELDLPLVRLDAAACQRVYDRYRTTPTRLGKPPAVDTHRNSLEQAKTFFAWCAYDRRWIPASPLAGVTGVGKRRKGKAQLRVSEARLWAARALELAQAGEDGAVAALLALTLGVREGEILGRQVRDVDDGARLFWVPSSKTEAGRRYLEVPEFLRPFLVRLTQDKPPQAALFDFKRGYVSGWVARICKQVGVPVVRAHSMRGLHSTLATECGMTSHVVAKAIGHGSPTVTEASYIAPGTMERMRMKRALIVLKGGGEDL